MSVGQRVSLVATTLIAAVIGVAALHYSAFGKSTRPAMDANGKTVVFWLVPMQIDHDLLVQLRDDFNAQNPDLDLQMTFVPGAQYQPKLKTLIASGHPPDLFYCGDVWVAYLSPFLADLSPLFARDAKEIDVDDIYPNVLQACRFDGKLCFAPRWFTVPLLYYNTTLFDAAGEPYPSADWTWTEYTAAASRLTRRGADGKIDTWGTNIVTGWWGEWLTLVRQAGGELFDADNTHCQLDSPEAIRGMQFYHDKIWKQHVAPPPGFGPDQGFVSGKLAMELVGHTGNWRTFNQIPGLKWDVTLLPRGPYSQAGGEMALEAIGMSNATPRAEQSWRFLKFMMSKRAIRAHVDAGYLSIRKSVALETHLSANHSLNPHNVKAVYDALAVGKSMPHGADFIEVALKVIQPEIDKMIADPAADVPAACRRATRAADDFLATIGVQRRIDAQASR